MRKLLLIVILFNYAITHGQENTVRQKLRTADDLKTGNSQDVLTSFFQMAFNDITGKEKTFKFQSSLFGIKAKTDSSLFIDTNYLRQTKARNLVFSIAPALDSNFKFQSNTLGIKYALVNNRDKAVFDFALPSEDEWAVIRRKALNEYVRMFQDGVNNPRYRLASNYFLDEDDEDQKKTTPEELPSDFVTIMKRYLSESQRFKNTSLAEFQDRLLTEYASLAEYVQNRGLLTVDGNFSSDKLGKLFSKINLNSEYLKGIVPGYNKMNVELNLRASLDFDDDSSSLSSKDLDRQILAFSGGLNWIIAKNRRSESIVELKGAITYNNIFKGVYAGENTNKLIAEGTFRVRVTNDLWIPFDIKYDPEEGNLFGFISVRSNFDWLKSKR
jgi:hypothetical protein